MYLAGGAAVHFYTGWRMTDDVDAAFDRKLLIPPDLTVIYRDSEGTTRSVYFDANYNESFALLHENAHEDARPLALPCIDARIFVLQPLDLAVSKLSRFADIDRNDIVRLAQDGLINADGLRQRAEEALPGYVGNPQSVRASLDIACRDIETIKPRREAKKRRRRRSVTDKAKL